MSPNPRVAAAAGTVSLLLAATACTGAGSAPADDISDVTLRVGDQTGATQALLDEAGLLDDVPYEIQWSEFAAAVNLHEALKADAIDVGGAADAPTVSAIAGGSAIQVIAAWSNDGKGTALVVPEDSDLETLSDLEGAEVSPTTRGSIAHFLLLHAFREEGLDINQVDLTFLAPVDAGTAFSSGNIDAWAVWGVYLARAQGDQGARVLADGEGLLPGLNVLSATDEALEEPAKVEALADLADRVDDGYAWGRENPEAYAEFYADFAGQPVEVAELVAESNTAYERLPVDEALGAELQETHQIWVEGGVLPDNELDLSDHIARNAPSIDN